VRECARLLCTTVWLAGHPKMDYRIPQGGRANDVHPHKNWTLQNQGLFLDFITNYFSDVS
jgi:hypothetical protein